MYTEYPPRKTKIKKIVIYPKNEDICTTFNHSIIASYSTKGNSE